MFPLDFWVNRLNRLDLDLPQMTKSAGTPDPNEKNVSVGMNPASAPQFLRHSHECVAVGAAGANPKPCLRFLRPLV